MAKIIKIDDSQRSSFCMLCARHLSELLNTKITFLQVLDELFLYEHGITSANEPLARFVELFLKDMVARNSGKILNVASIAGKVPGPYQAVYHGTKAFIHSFNEAIRSEVKASGSSVTITSLLPGATDTDFFNKADMQDAKVVKEGKLGDAAAVARDGYDALMAGKDMVISGFMNKVQVAMANVLPDSATAEQMRKTQAPANKDEEK